MIESSMLPDLIVLAIRSVAGSNNVSLHEPAFNGNEWRYVKECIDSTFVSSVGKFVDRFEADLATYTGARHAVAVVNGTAALHVALKLAGVQRGDEVLVPALTFVATANPVSYCSAIPHFVDSNLMTLGVDTEKLRDYLKSATFQSRGQCVSKASGRVIRALVPVHVFGHPVDLDGLMAIAHDFKIKLIEDASESLGSLYHGRHTGTFGQLGILSFNGNKTITTGGGGAILTDDTELARYAKHLTTTAKLVHTWEYRHDLVGYNYRLPNINAALGCAQLENMSDILNAQRALYVLYREAFADIEGVSIVAEPEGCRSNYWLQTLRLENMHVEQRDAILHTTNVSGYMTRPTWIPLHLLAPFVDCPRMDLSGAMKLSQSLINLPSSPSLVKQSK